MGLGWEKACGAGKVGGQPSLWTIGPAHQVPLRSLSVTLQIAPGRAGRPPPHPRFRARRGRGGGGRAICGLLLRLLLESPAQAPGSTSGELTPPRLQQTFAERPGAGDTPVPAATSPPPGKQREADSPSLPGRAKDKTDRERRRESSWEKLDCFAHSRLPTPPPRRPSGHEYPWESESAAGPCCHPQPDPVGGKADQRGHCSQG